MSVSSSGASRFLDVSSHRKSGDLKKLRVFVIFGFGHASWLLRRSSERAEIGREALAAYADGADFDFTIARLAGVGYKMELLLG